VRELIEILMNATGCWEPIVATLLASRPTAQPASLTQPDLPAQHNPDQLVTNSNQPK